MKALILAAGLGERMRPLTLSTPKPLLRAGGKTLIEWHLQRLAAIGVNEVVINTAWLAEQFPRNLGDGSRWGLRLQFSYEGSEPLETGGGMLHALPQLGDAPFLVINGDIYCDMDLSLLPQTPDGLAHLVMVDNPAHHAAGDFALAQDGRLFAGTTAASAARQTYSGIGLFRPQLLDGWQSVIGSAAGADQSPPRFKLAPLLFAAIARNLVSGQHHHGAWTDVGTPQRLAELDARLNAASALS